MLESWSSTASSAYGVDWGVKSTPLQSNKITDLLVCLPVSVSNSIWGRGRPDQRL